MDHDLTMKKLIALAALLLAGLAQAQVQPYNLTIQQRNATDTGYITRALATPAAGADGMVYYNGTTQLPGYVTMGAGLSVSSGVMSAASPAPFNFGTPTSRTLALSTAYQAADTTKAAIITLSPQCTNATTAIAASACTLNARVGIAGITCSTGTVVGTWTSTYALGLLLTNTSGSPFDIKLPAGAYFILCATAGTFTINNAVDQSAS